MSVTDLTAVAAQVQKFWSPLFMDELREETILPSLVNKNYSGEIKKKGDTVQVSQIQKANGELLDIPLGQADVFHPEKMVTTSVDVVADKRAVASFKITELAELQSQIGNQQSAIRDALMQGVMEQINNHLYSLVAPQGSHDFGGVANIDADDIRNARKLAGLAKWVKNSGWWALHDPNYYADLLGETTLVSSDYVGSETPTIAGNIIQKRFGFNHVEDNSRNTAQALFFHPDFMYLVTQKEPTFKISDLHSNEEFGYLISVDTIFGAKLGIEGAAKHIQYTAAA